MKQTQLLTHKTKIMKTKSSRKVRMLSKSRDCQDGYKRVPWLTLSGVWLAESGFNIGDVLQIISGDGVLYIKAMEAQEAEAYLRERDLRRIENALDELSK